MFSDIYPLPFVFFILPMSTITCRYGITMKPSCFNLFIIKTVVEYSDKFYDYNEPLKTIHFKVEGNVTYTALLFIPSHASYDYYSKEYTKGLQLYTNGVLIMDKCSDLLPDYYSFVRGVVDTEDIPLNISRETLQEDKNIKLIAKSIESKIKKELLSMLKEDREKYEKFYKTICGGRI